MKFLILVATLSVASFGANAAMTPSDALKKAPVAICAGHSSSSDCQTAIKAVLFASYQFTTLNASCENATAAAREKMNDQLKAQCSAAKDAVNYLETLQP
jgi:hypothetical protein